MPSRWTHVTVLLLSVTAMPALAQQAQPAPDSLADTIAAAAKTVTVADRPAWLVYGNREVVEYRATVLAQSPAVRAAAAIERLERLVPQLPGGRVTTRSVGEAMIIGIEAHPVMVLFHADADPLSGEDLATKTAAAATRLQQAYDEAVEIRTPRRLVRSGAISLAVTLIFGLAVWVLTRLQRVTSRRARIVAERQLAQLPGGETLVSIIHAPVFVGRLIIAAAMVLGLILTYMWLAFVMRQFPYTRPWGESLRGALFGAVFAAARLFIDQLPNLLIVLAVIVFVRFLARLASLFFAAVEDGRITIPWIHPDIAQPTRRILTALLWIFALVVSYDYLPGSGSDAFKGASVFVGLVVSLGSTGVMNQIMSGLMVTYSRALRLGDLVRIGEVEGTVTHLGALSTKVKTARNEEITIPNAIVVSQATTNYSRYTGDDMVFFTTSVTIGYDVPWRQVHALLLMAAARKPGVASDPSSKVLQTGLQDFYVQYTLFVCPVEAVGRVRLLAALHANIQDAFNEYGVQIMSPNYEADPSERKVVPRSQWHAAPAPASPEETPQTEPHVDAGARTPVA